MKSTLPLEQYGYGLFVNDECIHHAGSIEGFVSDLRYYYKEDLVIILLSNLEWTPIEDLSQGLARCLRPK